MTQDATTFLPDWASPPGDTLADLLDERRMTQTELAERLGVTLKHVNRVIKGAATISADLALGLEKVFGASAAFWMTREAHYQAARARHEQRQSFAEAVGGEAVPHQGASEARDLAAGKRRAGTR